MNDMRVELAYQQSVFRSFTRSKNATSAFQNAHLFVKRKKKKIEVGELLKAQNLFFFKFSLIKQKSSHWEKHNKCLVAQEQGAVKLYQTKFHISSLGKLKVLT